MIAIHRQQQQNCNMKFSKFARQFKPESGILQLMNDLGHAINSGRSFHMEPLIKSNYFMLVKTARNFPEDRSNRVTIAAHFEKVTNSFSCA